MAEAESVVTIDDLPITFQVKYLGQHDAGGLWGIKHTRRPVDNMVSAAKNLPSNQVLPMIELEVSTEGVRIESTSTIKRMTMIQNNFKIESISYGVQDLIYTRVFSMIVVKDVDPMHKINPFECHAFVCDSKNSARKLTYALAAAFQEYSERVKKSQMESLASKQTGEENAEPPKEFYMKKKFAIDLRTPEEIQADMDAETEA